MNFRSSEPEIGWRSNIYIFLITNHNITFISRVLGGALIGILEFLIGILECFQFSNSGTGFLNLRWFCPWGYLAISEGILLNSSNPQDDTQYEYLYRTKCQQWESEKTYSRSSLLQIMCIQSNKVYNSNANSSGLQWAQGLCISNKLSGGVDAAGPGLWITVWVARLWTWVRGSFRSSPPTSSLDVILKEQFFTHSTGSDKLCLTLLNMRALQGHQIIYIWNRLCRQIRASKILSTS